MIDRSIVLASFVALAWGVSPVMYKYTRADPQLIMIVSACVYFFATVAYVMLFPLKTDDRHIGGVIPVIVLAAFLSMFVGNLLYFNAIKSATTSSVAVVAAITSLYPVVTVLVSSMFVGDVIDKKTVVGIGVILFGLYLVVTASL